MQYSEKEVAQLYDYLKNGTSAFHVIAHTKELLSEAGFTELNLKDTWQLEKGGRYFCSPFDTTLYAFTIGGNCELSNGIHIAGAHTDFPAIKIKPNPEIYSHGYMQLNTEVYGGPILNTFFDRPLSLAGKVVCRGERYDKPDSYLIDMKAPVLYLPNLAIHMNREINEKGAPIDNQKHLLPLLGTYHSNTHYTGQPANLACAGHPDYDFSTFFNSNPINNQTSFLDLIRKELDRLFINADNILDYDLCIYNLDQPELVGYTGEFISAPRLDDITSVSALVHGLIEGENENRVNMICLFDNEEIGSLSKQGADSTLPATILGKIWQSFGKNYIDCMSDISDGIMLSVDVAHAYHPNYAGTQDITNYPVLNGGFCFKTASNQSYTWDSDCLASLIALCQQEGIPYQRFVKHSNTKGGGTIGSIFASHLPMKAADLGVGLLGMHSSREMMGKYDQIALGKFIKAFFTD